MCTLPKFVEVFLIVWTFEDKMMDYHWNASLNPENHQKITSSPTLG